MRKTVPMRVGELWDDFLKNSPGTARRLAEVRAAEVWPRIVGPQIAAMTTSVSVEKGVMYVKVSSSVARHEIFMQREALKNAVNKEVGMQVVNVLIVK